MFLYLPTTCLYTFKSNVTQHYIMFMADLVKTDNISSGFICMNVCENRQELIKGPHSNKNAESFNGEWGSVT